MKSMRCIQIRNFKNEKYLIVHNLLQYQLYNKDQYASIYFHRLMNHNKEVGKKTRFDEVSQWI
jgi:hypothetical protein